MNTWLTAVIVCIFSVSLFTGCTSGQPSATAPSAAGTADKEDFIIGGSGSNLTVTRQLLSEFALPRSKTITVPDSLGSGGGITGFQQGALDLALTSRPLTPAEKQTGLQEIPYAKSGLAVAVGPNVPDKNLSFKELVQIYNGEKTTWSDGSDIIVFLMYEKDSTNEVLAAVIPGFQAILADAFRQHRWQVFYNQQAQEEALSKTAGAIGFTNLSAKQNYPLTFLTVNGVTPTAQSIKTGSYPLYKTLYYVHSGALPPLMRDFIDFTFSERGRKLIEAAGCIPLER